MPRIVFTADAIFESEGPNKGPRFAKDEKIDCTQEFADRWTRRNVAEELSGKHDPKDGERFTRVAGKAASASDAAADKAAAKTPADKVAGATPAAAAGGEA